MARGAVQLTSDLRFTTDELRDTAAPTIRRGRERERCLRESAPPHPSVNAPAPVLPTRSTDTSPIVTSEKLWVRER
jgi:hypothetical protein